MQTEPIETQQATIDDGTTPQGELILFAEKEEALQWIESLANCATTSTKTTLRAAALRRLREIFDKYLECPTLLDPSLEDLVQRLSTIVLNCALDQQHVAKHVQYYALSALYGLSKVRGYKVTSRFLPHGVEHVEIVWRTMQKCKEHERERLQLLQSTTNTNENSCPTDPPPLWESVYMLRHWLSALSLVPFDTKIFDNTQDGGFSVPKLLQSTRQELDQAGPLREAAAACLAAWLSRPDLEHDHLPEFVAWTKTVVESFLMPPGNTQSTSSSLPSHANLFRLMGSCKVLCHLLKRSSVARQKLVDLFQPMLWDPLLVLADDDSTAVASNLILRKLLNKWWTRMSCAHLPPRVAIWRYQRGQRSLLDTTTRTALPDADETNKSLVVAAVPSDTATDTTRNDLFLVPDLVEDAMGRLLEALKHASTVVRWSAAKGVGRITERLPALCAEDVLDAILEMFQEYENDQSWHGACLTLAELARRGLLLPHRLDDVMPLVVKAVYYSLRRGNRNVGAHVRDAACYTFWAFARAYSPNVLRKHIKPLTVAVVLTSLFDREVNCRRAASAAFQEAVGRQGALNFPNGIAIITVADFFSLGNRREAYTSIAMQVAKFEEYRLPILEHLYREKLFHWDIAIRKLASTALAQLSRYDPAYLGKHAVPFLAEKSLDSSSVVIRHGAVLGVAEMIKAFAEQGALMMTLSDEMLTSIIALVEEIDKRRLYRGRGGEIMRAASCRLVECISLSKIALTVKDQVRMLDTVDACIPHPSEEIQECACSALGQLLSAYFPVGEKGPSERLQNRVVDKFIVQLRTSPNVAVTRGYALALGFLPAKLIAPSVGVLDNIFVALRETARPDSKVGNEGDAETRRNALRSLTKIVKTLQSSANSSTSYPLVTFNERHVKDILEVYFNSMEDYNTDRRGDVGSWCRMAAMKGLSELMTTERPSGDQVDWNVNPSSPTKVVGEFLKQLGQKLDVVRLDAGKNLRILLQDESLVIHQKQAVLEILGLNKTDYDWADPKNIFSNLLRVAFLDTETTSSRNEIVFVRKPYFEKVIAGIVLSSGGLTSATSKEASYALVGFAKVLTESNNIDILGRSILSLMKKHKTEYRVVVPVLKSLETLLLRQCLDPLLRETDSAFAMYMCDRLVEECRDCVDVTRLMLIVDVAISILRALPPDADSEPKVVGMLCFLLRSPFPRIRAHVSQHLYVVLNDMPRLIKVETDTEVMEMIINTPWGTDLNHGSVGSCATGIAEKLGVSVDFSSEPVVDAD